MTFVYGRAGRDEHRSVELICRAPVVNVRHLDTADVYGPRTNETLVGAAIADRRHGYLIATKCGLVPDPGRGTLVTRPMTRAPTRHRQRPTDNRPHHHSSGSARGAMEALAFVRRRQSPTTDAEARVE
jgi:aryl-alcohol dehydrogenase-like predicted oxidoreductase